MNKLYLLVLLIITNKTVIFSQNNDFQFFRYRLGTDMSQIIENEGYPDWIEEDINEENLTMVYINKNIKYFKIDYIFYTIRNNKLFEADLHFNIDNDIYSLYEIILKIILEYENIEYINSIKRESDYFISNVTAWYLEDIYIIISLSETKNNNILNNQITLRQSYNIKYLF